MLFLMKNWLLIDNREPIAEGSTSVFWKEGAGCFNTLEGS